MVWISSAQKICDSGTESGFAFFFGLTNFDVRHTTVAFLANLK